MKKYKISLLVNRFFLITVLLWVLSSCSKNNFSTRVTYQFKSETGIPDYRLLDYWAAHPWKKDPGDSVPRPLQEAYKPDSLADVFFIHPTTLTDFTDQRRNADIDDAEINAKTDYSSVLYQASVFNESCRVFAPRYRQAHIRSFYSTGSDTEKAFEIAYSDVKAAFIYYLKNLNMGRPIIIASHSQGTTHAGRLLKEFFENKPLSSKLVCAYILGMPVPDDYFTSLKPCTDSLATGCFVAWRTYKSGYEPAQVANEKFRSVVINPLTWTTGEEPVSSSFNQGGILKNFNKLVRNTVSTQIHKNILWSSKPNVPGKIFFNRKNYHIGDINLFYMNIRKNVSARINSYRAK